MEYNVTFTSLPVTMEEFKASPLAALSRPEHTAALTVAALCLYPKDKDTALAMLDFLRGPRPLSVMEKQFINDRFMDGKDYIPRSYFTGASPDNDYTPAQPYTIRMADSHAPIAEEGYQILDLFYRKACVIRRLYDRSPDLGSFVVYTEKAIINGRLAII